jgi:predicted enzyme related to lactoylglutathione lyase
MNAFALIRTAAIAGGALLLGVARLTASGAGEFPPLNNSPTGDRLDGKFIWADLFTTDPAGAAKLYQEMFEWAPTTFTRDGRAYVLLKHDDRPVAGIVQRSTESVSGTRARWVGYVAVNDIARTLTLVGKFRGKVLAPAREFPPRGTQAMVVDNEGAVLGLLHSSSGDPDDYQPEIGEWIWAELYANQPDVAATFYRNVFGYEVTSAAAGENKTRFVLSAGGFARAGISSLPAKEDARPAWLGFVRVGNADAAAARASALGGRVLVTPQVSHLGTRFAIVTDPTGGAVAVIEFNASKTSSSTP